MGKPQVEPEMIKRLARAANGGSSFANDYARRHMEKIVINIVWALTEDDLKIILEEIKNNS